VQVLDDSTDESFDVAAAKVAEWQAKGLDIIHVKRPIRKGFKAGALAYGLERSKGEFTAIFDADFLPDPDFLEKTIPQFKDARPSALTPTLLSSKEDVIVAVTSSILMGRLVCGETYV